jgi:methionine sulfoxide reductase heme-binding subunit
VLHYYWLVKSDVRKPLMYAAIVAILLAFRLFARLMKSRGTATVRASS